MSSITSAKSYRGREDIASQLLGDSDFRPQIISDYNQYESIYKIRHDLIHALICDNRGYTFGEQSLSQINKEIEFKWIDGTYLKLIENQTPDIFEYRNNMFKIIEVTVSATPGAYKKKEGKYALLNYFLTRNKFKVDYEVIVINPKAVYSNSDSLKKIHKLFDATIDNIAKICKNTNILLAMIHNTEDGRIWQKQFFKVLESEETINYTVDDVLYAHDELPNKCFHSKSDLIELLSSQSSCDLNVDDEKFIDHIVNHTKNHISTLEVKQSFDEENFKNSFKKFPQFDKIRPIFPLPFFMLKDFDPQSDAIHRGTRDDLVACVSMASAMENCEDAIHSAIGKTLLKSYNMQSQKEKAGSFLYGRPRFEHDEKRVLAIDGPGRKHFVKKNDPECIAKQLENHEYNLKYETETNFVRHLSYWLTDDKDYLGNLNFQENCERLSTLNCRGLRYALICQSIFRELNINSLRKERRHDYLLKNTGVEGVFILIYPGLKMKAGELVNQIWFKILVSVDKYNPISVPFPQAFRSMKSYGSHFGSDWLTTDAHRLDHYLRCYDKILMSYFSIMQSRFRTASINNEESIKPHSTIFDCVLSDSTNVLGLIILTFLEDKRSTSKTLQNARYLVMTSISIFPYYTSVMEKVIEPVRSVLQLYYIHCMVRYIKKMMVFKISDNISFGRVKYDPINKTFDDEFGGSVIKLPRLFISEASDTCSEFSETLSEMYFTMLFNKNQDDPTHASMQILDKMLEGESLKEKAKEKNNHLGYLPGMTDIDFADRIINDNATHQFSKRAIEIGSILYLRRNGVDLHSALFQQSVKPNVDKTVDDFATFKSSAINENLFFDEKKKRQNSRRRCIGGVMSLLKDGLKTSIEVAHKFKNDDTRFQVFKKNQIGGVREILILSIQKRIMINILESISRNFCKLDEREMLTHGDIKLNMIKSHLIEARKLQHQRFLLYYNFDKSRWGPSFIPIQFLYLFTRFKDQAPKMFNYITHLLIKHQNKKCLYPERLISIWFKDPQNKKQHRFNDLLQMKKEQALNDKKIYFENESNMGQGILHYTSSYLHMALISFRDELYKRLLKKLNLSNGTDHFDLISSDDSFTVQSLRIKNIKVSKLKISLFLKCQEISEFLFNVRTSKSKSSISAIIGEFNSVFFSNLTMFPTLIKFAISSVHPPNTDSFYRMVKESYISSRQIVENGGTLELYYISQIMNKRFCEGIYHTYPGGVNDLNMANIPYQIGIYPIFEPSLMLSFGPEFHNYKIYKNWNSLNSQEQVLFMACHKVIKGDLVETLADLESTNIALGGLLRIEAHIRPISLLLQLKREAILNKEELTNHILDKPIDIIDDPKTLEQVIFKTCLKLYQTSASEALKNNPASIYFGRMSATVSANAFMVPNGDNKLVTYRECLDKILNETVKYQRFDDIIKFIYPRWDEYEIFENYAAIQTTINDRSLFQIQTVHTLEFSRIHTKLTFRIKDILKYYWMGEKPERFSESKLDRDWSIISSHFPLIKTTMQETIDQFHGDTLDKTKSMIMLLLKLHNLKDRTIKAILFGQNTRDIRETIEILQSYNYYSGIIMGSESKKELRKPVKVDYDRIYWLHNYAILSSLAHDENWFQKFFSDPINFDAFQMDPTISINTKKRLMILLCASNRITSYEDWSKSTDTILHYWDIPQTYIEGRWMGDFMVTVFRGYETVRIRSQSRRIFIYINKHIEPERLHEMVMHACGILNMSEEDLWNNVDKGDWMVQEKRIFQVSNFTGFKIIKSDIVKDDLSIFSKIEVNEEFTTLMDDSGNQLMRVKTGLLSTVHHEDVPDFEIFHMKFSNISYMRAFSSNFNVLYKDSRDLIKYIDDLVVEKPEISEITKIRLKLDEKWSIYNLDEEEAKLEEVTMTDQTMEEYFESLITFEPEDISNEESKMIQDFGYIDDFIISFNKEGLFTTFETVSEMIRTRQIFRNIKRLKYSIIASQLLFELRINSSTITMLNRIFKNEYITYVLVAIYDETYKTRDTISPESSMIKINDEFVKKFDL